MAVLNDTTIGDSLQLKRFWNPGSSGPCFTGDACTKKRWSDCALSHPSHWHKIFIGVGNDKINLSVFSFIKNSLIWTSSLLERCRRQHCGASQYKTWRAPHYLHRAGLWP